MIRPHKKIFYEVDIELFSERPNSLLCHENNNGHVSNDILAFVIFKHHRKFQKFKLQILLTLTAQVLYIPLPLLTTMLDRLLFMLCV